MIRPESAGGPGGEPERPGQGRRGGGIGRSRRRLALAASAAALTAAAIVAVVVTGGGSPSPPSSPAPAPQRSQGPPWGFTGGWQPYCYRGAPDYTVTIVAVKQSCPAGSTRVSTLQQVELSARAGATIDRLAVSWASVEPRPPVRVNGVLVHRLRWAPVVRIYRALLSAGIRPLVLVYGAPTWARRGDWARSGACRAAYGEPCSYPPSPRHLSDWRAFVRSVARQLPRMLALEVWNEPNLPRFFAPRADPRLYSRLLRIAHGAVRASGSAVPVLSGGLAAGASGRHGSVRAASFLAATYRYAGKASFDGIGTHPYPQGPPWVAEMTANLNRLRRVRDRFSDHATPLWITEVGMGGTSGGRHEGNVGLSAQGPILARMYRSVRHTDVRSFVIFALRDSTAVSPKYSSFGVVRASLRAKPAYCYVARHIGGAPTCVPGSGSPAGRSGG